MAVRSRGLFFAVLAAHALATKNRFLRELGRRGAWALVALIALLATTSLFPILAMMSAAGFWLGKALPDTNSAAMLGAVLAGLSLFGGLLGGIVGGAKQLTWESYRLYPLRRSALFLAEIVAGFTDLMPLIFSLAMIALLGGATVAHPIAAPFLFLALVEGLLTIILVQLFIGSLAEALVSRVRTALVATILLVVASPVVLASLHRSAALHADTFAALRRAVPLLRSILAYLPSSFAIGSVNDALGGHPLLGLARHAYPLAALGALALVVERILSREAATPSFQSAGAGKIWSFRTPALGMARLQFQTLLQSRIGRFGFLIPLFTIVIVRGPLAVVGGQRHWAVPGAFAYLSLVANQFQLNQFGLDGHGIKALLLLPIEPSDLLRGKAWGLFAYQALQSLLLALLLALTMHTPVAEIAAGLAVSAAFALLQNTVGMRTSVWMPRALPRKSIRSNATPLPLVLLGLGLSFGAGALLSSAYAMLSSRAPALLPWGMGAIAIVFGVLRKAMLPGAARGLARSHEKLLGALT